MLSKRQHNASITDYGAEIEKLATKLAAAHVSQGTFTSEAAASNIVESVAVRAFVDGLQNPTTQFLLRARNPTSLNKAVSDALECNPGTSKPKNEMALWCNSQYYPRRGSNNNWRGRASGYRRGRGFSRGRGNFHRGNFQQYNNNGNRGNNHNNNNNHNNETNNNRNRHSNAHANVAEQNNNRRQPNEEEAEVNVVAELFRE